MERETLGRYNFLFVGPFLFPPKPEHAMSSSAGTRKVAASLAGATGRGCAAEQSVTASTKECCAFQAARRKHNLLFLV